ncbi:MAG: diacylglycerol kinase family lipid kinase [Bacillota bacterium]|nr:diacylglycerol kinase family lipid kinase [Bacillota bacterium]
MIPQDFLCVVNPAAGRGRTARLWPEIARAMRSAGLHYRVVFTEAPGHGTELAREAALHEAGTVVAVGGDGTINEVVNGLAASGVPLALIPTGNGNDFCRALGIVEDPLMATLALCTGRYRCLDLGIAGDRYFLNICGIGFDAEVAHAVNNGLRWLSGTPAYFAGIIRTLLSFKPVPLHLTLDGAELETKGLLVAVANGPYYGAGIKIAPKARPDDGFFEVCIIGELSRFELLRTLPLAFRGQHETHPQVKFFRAREVTVSCPVRTLYIQGDGELLGATPASFRIVERGLKVLVPDEKLFKGNPGKKRTRRSNLPG